MRERYDRRKRRQRELVAASQLRLFVFAQHADMSRLDMLESLLRTWRRILEYSAEHDAPLIATISRDGTFSEVILPPIAEP